MAINVVKRNPALITYSVRDLIEGRAYVELTQDRFAHNTVFICNRYDDLVAFSVCGDYVVQDVDTSYKFKEVTLNIEVIE